MAVIYETLEIHDAEKKGTGKWHMTMRSDEEGWCHATGPCAIGCPGHETREEATRHWKEGQLEDIRYREADDEKKKCQVCGEWTTRRAMLWLSPFAKEFVLCEKHANKEEIAKIHLK